ncbi:lipopolysaccharide transport periplasmic protein LptA [Desulfolithobacter sp.]
MFGLPRSALKPLLAIVITSFILAAAPFLSAATTTAPEPIHVEADRMVSQEKDSSVVFMGNVEARQGDLVIRADEMTVFYTPGKDREAPGSSQVHRLVCRGNVEITRDDWLGTGRRMDYLADERKVVLIGDAKAWQGRNMVAGKTITYYLDEGRSIVEQDKTKTGGRVRAVIHPEATKKKKQKQKTP